MDIQNGVLRSTLCPPFPSRRALPPQRRGGSWARICFFGAGCAGSPDPRDGPPSAISPPGSGAFMGGLCVSGFIKFGGRVDLRSRPKLGRGFDFGLHSRLNAGLLRGLPRFHLRRYRLFSVLFRLLGWRECLLSGRLECCLSGVLPVSCNVPFSISLCFRGAWAGVLAHRACRGAYIPVFRSPCPLPLPLWVCVLSFEDMRSHFVTESSDSASSLLQPPLPVFPAF